MEKMIPEKLRVSIGTAALLGLADCRLDVKPTTAYLMTYTEDRCIANCAFCPQSRGGSSKKSLLSRVLWPVFPTVKVMKRLRHLNNKVLRRICIQVINYPNFIDDVLAILKSLKVVTELPVSLDTPPLERGVLERLRDAGINRIGIPLDAATPKIFDEVKGRLVGGPYSWEKHLNALSSAVEVFGIGRVMSNLIIGLGETEEEAVELIQRLKNMGVLTALFALTPIPGTLLADCSPPALNVYRRVQMARYLIMRGMAHFDEMEFEEDGRLLDFGVDSDKVKSDIWSGEAFQTSGCPGCNRPYYNERPSGPLYNYPRRLTLEEARQEVEMMGIDVS